MYKILRLNENSADPNLMAFDLYLHCFLCEKLLRCLIIHSPMVVVLSVYSTLDKQRICVNTQLKSSKKELK